MAISKLADISYTDGLKLLYLRKQALDAGKLPRIPKDILDQTNILSAIHTNYEKKAFDLVSRFNELPIEAQRGLMGTGIGGGVGALAGLLSNRKKDTKSNLRKALGGGLSGAALGGGIGVLSPMLDSVIPKAVEEAKKTKAPTSTEVALSKLEKDFPNLDDAKKTEVLDALDRSQNPPNWFYQNITIPRLGGLAGGIGGTAGTPALLDKIKERYFRTLKSKDEIINDISSTLVPEAKKENTPSYKKLEEIYDKIVNKGSLPRKEKVPMFDDWGRSLGDRIDTYELAADSVEDTRARLNSLLSYGKRLKPEEYTTEALFGKLNNPTELGKTVTKHLSDDKNPYSLSTPNKFLSKATRPGLNRSMVRGMGGFATSALGYGIPKILGYGAEDPQVQQDNALLKQYGLLPGASTPAPAPAPAVFVPPSRMVY